MLGEIREGNWSRPAALILVLAGAVMGLILVSVGQWLTFWLDEWDFIFGRQSGTIHSFIAPHVDAFVLVPAAVYYVAIHVWGLSSYYPVLMADWLAHFLCVALLAVIVTRKSGALIGLMAGLSLLFLGSAYEALLQPFQMQYLFSAAGGLLALLLLDREVRATWVYIAAAIALLFAIASSGVGPIVAGMILVWSVLRRDWASALVTAPALATYGVWYLAWQSRLSRIPGSVENLVNVPIEIVYGIGAAVAGVSGLPPLRFAWVGAAIGLTLVVAVVFLVGRHRLRLTPLAVAALVALLTEYGLHAVFRGAMGLDHAARSAYLYPAAIFIWLAVAGTVGRRLDPARWTGGRRPRALALIGLLIVPMALANMTQFFLAGRALQVLRATEARELTLIERLRNVPGLALNVTPDVALLGNVSPKRYFAAIDQFGSPHINGVSDDLPGPDSSALNAVAMRLLGPAINVGPPGTPGPSAPALKVASGRTGPSDDPSCALLVTESGLAQATWAPSGGGVAVRIDEVDVDLPDVQISIGIFEPADAAAPVAAQNALRRGETIWLPTLPPDLAWSVRVSVTGNATLDICNRQ